MAVLFASAVLALALLTVLPGPDMAVVTRVALAHGRAGAVRAGLGIVSGLLVWGLLTVAGLAALLAASATAYTVVRLAGAAYLVWLGVQALRSSCTGALIDPAQVHGPGTTSATAYRTGLLSNLLNRKIAVFYTGLLPNLVPSGAPHTITLVALVLVHAVLSLG